MLRSPLAELTVVIPTLRRSDALERTLAALERQTLDAGHFEVVVVADRNDDPGSVAEAVRADSRPFRTRQLQGKRGGASPTRNTGWRAAETPLVLFIGNDILLSPPALGEHLNCHLREPDEAVGVLGPVVWAEQVRVTPFMRWLDEGIQFDYASLHG